MARHGRWLGRLGRNGAESSAVYGLVEGIRRDGRTAGEVYGEPVRYWKYDGGL